MCGIIGILGLQDAAPLLVDGLKRLEYRGYDSAGIATLHDGKIGRLRAKGKLVNLADKLAAEGLAGTAGIGHTRWATHGIANETNAHPHATDRMALVHNGIIENFQELRQELEGEGVVFETETDTEVVAHLITRELNAQLSPKDAVAKTLPRLHGAFALAMLFTGEDNLMIGARKGSPLALGYGEGQMFLGSDAMALAPLTRQIAYLDEGDWVVVTREGAQVYDRDNRPVTREIKQSSMSGAMIGKGEYRHFMLKEIHEQPSVVGDTLHSYINPQARTITLPPLPFSFEGMSRLIMSACGTALLAAEVSKYWFEGLARLAVEADIASEYRYRQAVVPEQSGAIFVSQSGETIDTLEALRYAKGHGAKVLSIVNVPESSIARESDAIVQTLAGPEIGVASTKAFTTQLTVLAGLALTAAKQRGHLSAAREAELVDALVELPEKIRQVLAQEAAIGAMADKLVEARSALFLGRGSLCPIAYEGALKLKEISYIHAEGYASGEMKHGPIALIDEHMPIISCAPSNYLFDKAWSNLEEARARGGQLMVFTDQVGADHIGSKVPADRMFIMPDCDPFVAPILYVVPLQVLAYHTAVLKGTDVDQPRNLAKSVTVE